MPTGSNNLMTSSKNRPPPSSNFSKHQELRTHTLLQHIRTLHKALSHIHHHAKYVERAEAIYAVGLLHLAAIFYFPSSTHRSKQWRARFLQLQVHPEHYTYSHFLAPNSVYVKLFFNSHDTHRCYDQHGHCYVGSTAIGIPGRERNRRAKLKQLAKNTPISAGVALHYTDTPLTLSPSSPPSTLPHTQTMTRPGSMNICTSPDGNLHSIGLTFHSTSNSKQTVGNSAGIEPISFHALPITIAFFDDYDDDYNLQPNLSFTRHTNYTPSPSFETSPNTHEHPSMPPDSSAPANTPILKFTPFVAWLPALKNQGAAGLSTFSTKP